VMTHLLDTNACVDYLRSPGESRIHHMLARTPPGSVVLCSVVKAELFYGAQRSRNSKENLAKVKRFLNRFTSLPFDDKAAEVYGQIRSTLESQGTPIGPNDLMIAAIALANGVTLVTHNAAEFQRAPALKIEDWQAGDQGTGG